MASGKEVTVPLQKRVDLMMEREKEKQLWLDDQRLERQRDEERECTFKPKLVSSKPPLYYQPHHQYGYNNEPSEDTEVIEPPQEPVYDRLYKRKASDNGPGRPTLAMALAL